jgi:hypothetical protein
MNTNEEEQIRVDPCVLVLDFIHANDSLVSQTAEMGRSTFGCDSHATSLPPQL